MIEFFTKLMLSTQKTNTKLIFDFKNKCGMGFNEKRRRGFNKKRRQGFNKKRTSAGLNGDA
jgi:hypothetical protein